MMSYLLIHRIAPSFIICEERWSTNTYLPNESLSFFPCFFSFLAFIFKQVLVIWPCDLLYHLFIFLILSVIFHMSIRKNKSYVSFNRNGETFVIFSSEEKKNELSYSCAIFFFYKCI